MLKWTTENVFIQQRVTVIANRYNKMYFWFDFLQQLQHHVFGSRWNALDHTSQRSATLSNETMCFDGKSLGQIVVKLTKGVDM